MRGHANGEKTSPVHLAPNVSLDSAAAPCLAVPLGKMAAPLISFLWDCGERPSEAFISLEHYFHASSDQPLIMALLFGAVFPVLWERKSFHK